MASIISRFAPGPWEWQNYSDGYFTLESRAGLREPLLKMLAEGPLVTERGFIRMRAIALVPEMVELLEQVEKAGGDSGAEAGRILGRIR